jgi:hydroxymethylpyrimidine kinase/phosphomethylpyrimidine kinase
MLYRCSVACFGCFLVYIARVHALVPPGVISSSSNPPAPVVLSIAGSDSGGGAGIQADLHAIHSFGCHGCTAITCVTAQNSVGVSAVHEIPPGFLREQLHALDKDFSTSSIKIGMVFSSDNAKEIANFLASYHEKEKQRPWIVCDPVMISTSGSALISAEAKRTMIEEIFPHVDVLTPNKFEAEELLGKKLQTFADVEQGKF